MKIRMKVAIWSQCGFNGPQTCILKFVKHCLDIGTNKLVVSTYLPQVVIKYPSQVFWLLSYQRIWKLVLTIEEGQESGTSLFSVFVMYWWLCSSYWPASSQSQPATRVHGSVFEFWHSVSDTGELNLTGVGAVTVSRVVEQSQSNDSGGLILEALFCVGDSCNFCSKGTKESINSAWLL